jgi:hypothetical protein
MRVQLPIVDFSSEQRELWKRVSELWELSKGRDRNQIRAALHPGYVGWDMSAPVPHDREAAVLSVSGEGGIPFVPPTTTYSIPHFTVSRGPCRGKGHEWRCAPSELLARANGRRGGHGSATFAG